MNYTIRIFILIIGVLQVGCGDRKKPDFGLETNLNSFGHGEDFQISSIHFYKGGFMPAPGQPNWSNDMTIDVSKMVGGAYVATSKVADVLCSKGGAVSNADLGNLYSLISQATFYPSLGPKTADAGVAYVEIKWSSDTLPTTITDKFHLMNMEVPVGEYYVSNGSIAGQLSTVLMQIDSALPTVCQ